MCKQETGQRLNQPGDHSVSVIPSCVVSNFGSPPQSGTVCFPPPQQNWLSGFPFLPHSHLHWMIFPSCASWKQGVGGTSWVTILCCVRVWFPPTITNCLFRNWLSRFCHSSATHRGWLFHLGCVFMFHEGGFLLPSGTGCVCAPPNNNQQQTALHLGHSACSAQGAPTLNVELLFPSSQPDLCHSSMFLWLKDMILQWVVTNTTINL